MMLTLLQGNSIILHMAVRCYVWSLLLSGSGAFCAQGISVLMFLLPAIVGYSGTASHQRMYATGLNLFKLMPGIAGWECLLCTMALMLGTIDQICDDHLIVCRMFAAFLSTVL